MYYADILKDELLETPEVNLMQSILDNKNTTPQNGAVPTSLMESPQNMLANVNPQVSVANNPNLRETTSAYSSNENPVDLIPDTGNAIGQAPGMVKPNNDPMQANYSGKRYSGKLRGKEWLQALKENAEVVGRELGIDPKIIMAQQIQENGWKGKKLTGKNNFFNIKGKYKGKGSTHKVWEIVNGKKVWVNDSFRDYDNPFQSAKDYASLIKRRYNYALKYKNNPTQYIKAVAKKYATDPDYAKNIISIYKSKKLSSLFS